MEFVKVYEYGEYIGKIKADVETIANLLAQAHPQNEFSINGGEHNLPIILTMGTIVQDYFTDVFDLHWFNEEFFPLFNKKLDGENEIKEVSFIEKERNIPHMEVDVEVMSNQYPVTEHLFIYNHDKCVGTIENTLENIANYIAGLKPNARVKITDTFDTLILTTAGGLLDHVPHQYWLETELRPALITKHKDEDQIKEVVINKEGC